MILQKKLTANHFLYPTANASPRMTKLYSKKYETAKLLIEQKWGQVTERSFQPGKRKPTGCIIKTVVVTSDIFINYHTRPKRYAIGSNVSSHTDFRY